MHTIVDHLEAELPIYEHGCLQFDNTHIVVVNYNIYSLPDKLEAVELEEQRLRK